MHADTVLCELCITHSSYTVLYLVFGTMTTSMNKKDDNDNDNNKLQAGLCVQFRGLKSVPELNGTYGTLIKFHKKQGRWAVRKDEKDDDKESESSGSKTIAVKPENLGVAKEDAFVSITTPGLDPPVDKWNFTDTSNISADTMNKYRTISSAAQSIAEAEQKIYVHVNGGDRYFEAGAFPTLFMFGSGMFGQDPTRNIRFEAYLFHLTRQHTGQFLKHDGWLQFVTKHAAIFRAITKRPPMWKYTKPERKLDARDIAALQTLTKTEETKAFCFRYLVGDKEAATLAIMYMQDKFKSRG
jgi:hypothetical protein